MISEFVNVNVVCEGQTEVDLVKKLNKRYFNGKKISLKPLMINKLRRQSLGGNVDAARVVKYVRRAEFAIVTTFVDFYGFQGRADKNACEIEKELKTEINKEFFIPYLQMYETEALLFSDIEAIALVKNASDGQKRLLAEITSKNNPEEINDGEQTAPSKRLKNIFRDYKKLYDGNKIFDKIQIETMKLKCPRFAKWLDEIEKTSEIFRQRKQA